jgi:hypothetical protein
MEKQLLLKNILVELSQLPEAYLQHWYELIHTFREKLPVQEDNAAPQQDADFDWDAFVEQTMKHRSQSNRRRAKRMEVLMND